MKNVKAFVQHMAHEPKCRNHFPDIGNKVYRHFGYALLADLTAENRRLRLKKELNEIEIKQREMLNKRFKNRKPSDDCRDCDLIHENDAEDSAAFSPNIYGIDEGGKDEKMCGRMYGF